eukprot:SM000074S21726  [mRNA]  locus=s74:606223:608057:- [translate_table: standard]
MRRLQDETVVRLPVFSVGHSLGALAHLLIGSRYAVQRAGNVFISFNNKEASKAIPLLSPVILPFAQNFGPLLSQLTASPGVRMGAEMAIKQLQNLSPPMLRQLLPLVEQLPPLYVDLTSGKDAFVPSPDETTRMVKQYYGVKRNLLLRFSDDSIDETARLADMLSRGSSVSTSLDLSFRVLPGDHARPLQQLMPEVEIPQGVMDVVSQGGQLFQSLATGTPLADFARSVNQSIGVPADPQRFRQEVTDDVEQLVDELAIWMGLGAKAATLDVYSPPRRF